MVRLLNPFYSRKLKPQQLAEVYTSCSELPLYNFIEIVLTGDLNWLIKTPGIASRLSETWAAIYSEYGEISQDQTTSETLKLARSIQYLSNRIFIVKNTVNNLSLRRINGLVSVLQEMGFGLTFADLEKDCRQVLSKLKTDEITLKKNKATYTKLIEGSAGVSTKMDWYGRLRQIAKYSNVASINPKLISVTEYVAMDRDFKDYISTLKRK